MDVLRAMREIRIFNGGIPRIGAEEKGRTMRSLDAATIVDSIKLHPNGRLPRGKYDSRPDHNLSRTTRTNHVIWRNYSGAPGFTL